MQFSVFLPVNSLVTTESVLLHWVELIKVEVACDLKLKWPSESEEIREGCVGRAGYDDFEEGSRFFGTRGGGGALENFAERLARYKGEVGGGVGHEKSRNKSAHNGSSCSCIFV